MTIKHIIFDLDGTLIDSSSSILASFHGAFNKVGLKPIRPLTADIIGPPLRKTLAILSGSNNPVVLDELATAFKEHYDTVGYRQTVFFPGVPEMLTKLSSVPLPLYIATNKRLKPAHLIIEHLGWVRRFSGVYALDSVNPPAIDKADLLARIVSTHLIDPQNTLYVGDRAEDREAATKNKIKFGYATWGYGSDIETSNTVESHYLKTPESLLIHLDQQSSETH